MFRLRPRHKHRILWAFIGLIGFLLFLIIVIPPMIRFDSIKPKIEEIILKQTGIPAKIQGDVNISLLGQTTIVAHDISVPNGVISSCEFSVPFFSIFNIENAPISGGLNIRGASLLIEKITPFDMNTNIGIKKSKIKFLNKEYYINRATLSKNKSNINLETDQHTYQITTKNNEFTVKNKNNELTLTGTLFDNGTATAHISIKAQDINKWFEFDKPKISGRFPITADIKWDGGYGIEFLNISANGATGDAVLQDNGYKIINLTNKNADYDMSFILKDSEILKNASFNLDFYGKIRFLDKTFKHIYLNVSGREDEIKIKHVVVDDLSISGGTIDENGAHNLSVEMMENGKKTTCLFNGTPNDWYCEKFSYDNQIFGTLNVNREGFSATIRGKIELPDIKTITDATQRFGNNGIIKFDFNDASGIITIKNKQANVEYNVLRNKSLAWLNSDLPFLPESMYQETGDFVWQNETMMFVPKSKTWNLTTTKDYFQIVGKNFKVWFPDMNLKFMYDLPYTLSGNYNHGNISDLTLKIANQEFIGSASNKSITLKTDILNLDSFVSQKYIDNFDQNSFFDAAPIVTPFNIDANIALSANALIYRGEKYNNFVYSLKKNTQTFSITDSDRGNLLAQITKDNTNYSINIQLNKFVFDEKLLPQKMPLNISNSSVTAEIKLKTSGKIAHDFYENITGTFDATFNGGILHGIGFQEFYASANDITILNAEYALARALTGGTTPIKKMRIVGNYKMGDINNTQPIALSMRHIDAIGDFKINDNKMFASFKFILRGTSPEPAPIELSVYDDNYRDYYLYEIMNNFDPDYMRSFIKSHDKF